MKSLPVNSAYDQIVRFYVNETLTDSLFREITHESSTPFHTDEKQKTVYASYFDRDGNPVVIRYKFFFPKKKSYPDRIRISIQKGSLTYNPETAESEMEYRQLAD